jgi:hypothetical protein
VAPNVVFFTTEPDVLFLHPDYRSFVRGTLVASSYPLFDRTQALFSTSRWRRQFDSMPSQGRVNALVGLLHRPDLFADCLPARRGSQGAPAGADTCTPAGVWLGLVGQERFLLLDAIRVDAGPATTRLERAVIDRAAIEAAE